MVNNGCTVDSPSSDDGRGGGKTQEGEGGGAQTDDAAALGSGSSTDPEDSLNQHQQDLSTAAGVSLMDESAVAPTATKTEIQSNLPRKPEHRTVKRKLLCLYCERSFVSANLRQKHVERVHSLKPSRRVSARRLNQLSATPCSYCDKYNDSEHTLNDLFQHLTQEHLREYFGCLQCEERFLNSTQLVEHNSTKHFTETPTLMVILPNASSQIEQLGDGEAEEEVTHKLTRSKLKSKLSEESSVKSEERVLRKQKKKSKLKELREKKITVKSSKIALKRSTRLKQQTKEHQEAQKKRRDKNGKQQLNTATKQTGKSKPTCINPYPEFDHFYRVKKISDHSIDNLKISSLTFDDVFDKAFFNRIKCNIEENLLHHIDGKLFKNEESESRISNFEKVQTVQEAQNSNSENYGCELSLNAATPTTSLAINSQVCEDLESQIEYGSKPSKKKPPVKSDEVHYKYFTRRKYQASILQQKENRDLSKLDMWTQMVVKDRQERLVNKKKNTKEMQEYTCSEEYKNKIRRQELNRILDRRGPFEDLKEEASKKAAFDKLNSVSTINPEVFSDVREVLNDLLTRVFETIEEDEKVLDKDKSVVMVDQREIPAFLNLRRKTSATNEEMDQSDKIALICSSQETENFELPSNSIRDKNEQVELTGEWARSRMYICAACGGKFSNMKYLLEHKSAYHQNVWVQHYEFVGNQSELYRHLSIPSLGKVGVVEETVPCKQWRRSESRMCSKCGKQCNSLGELHRHMLECGGDWTWMLARRKVKYRPFRSKYRRKRTGFEPKIQPKRKTDPTEKKIDKKPVYTPRQKPSDAETIQRMLANLPAKRCRRNIMSLPDAFKSKKAKNTKQNAQSSSSSSKLKCGKAIRVKHTSDGPNQNQKRRNLRSLNRVLSSRILDVNSTLIVKRKLQMLRSQRLTRSSAAVKIQEEVVESVSEEAAQKKQKVPKKDIETSDIKMRPRRAIGSRLNLKNFFPVKKKNSSTQKQSVDDYHDDSTPAYSQHKNKKGGLKGFVRALSLRKRTSREEENLRRETKPLEAVETGKRKLTRCFRNVINKVKKLKTEKVDKKSEVAAPEPFLEEQESEDVTPSETKENQPDTEEPLPIATEEKENPPIPETMFDLADNEGDKSLQAKGELDFDTKIPEVLTPVAIDTTLKAKSAPMLSPNVKGKIRKPNRGLNDCIAMLTSKLHHKDDKVSSSLESLFSTSSTTSVEPRPILKLPTFIFTQAAEETALDLTKKCVSTPDLTNLVIQNEKPLTAAWSSVDDIIQQVVTSSMSYTVEKEQKLVGKRTNLDNTIDFVVNSWFDKPKKHKKKRHSDDNLITNILFGKDKLIIAPSSNPQNDDPLIARIKECVLKTTAVVEDSSKVTKEPEPEISVEDKIVPLSTISLAEKETINPKVDNNKDMTETSTTDSLKENLQENPNTDQIIVKKTRKKRKLKFSQKKRTTVIKPLIMTEEDISTISIPVESSAPVAELTSQSRSSSEPNLNEMPSKVDKPLATLNSQRTRRKSKSSKKLEKLDNDMFKEFALVINKKTKRIPPTNIVDEKLDEADKELDLNDSVEEMDMEIDDIPISTNIIERTDLCFAEVINTKEDVKSSDLAVLDQAIELNLDSSSNTPTKTQSKKRTPQRRSLRNKTDSFEETVSDLNESQDEIDGKIFSSTPITQNFENTEVIDNNMLQQLDNVPIEDHDLALQQPEATEDNSLAQQQTKQLEDADQLLNEVNLAYRKESEVVDQLLTDLTLEDQNALQIVDNANISDEPKPETEGIVESISEAYLTKSADEKATPNRKVIKRVQKRLKKKMVRKKSRGQNSFKKIDDKVETQDCDNKSIPTVDVSLNLGLDCNKHINEELKNPENTLVTLDDEKIDNQTTNSAETPLLEDSFATSVKDLPENEPKNENTTIKKRRGRKKSKVTLPVPLEKCDAELEASRVTRGRKKSDVSSELLDKIEPVNTERNNIDLSSELLAECKVEPVKPIKKKRGRPPKKAPILDANDSESCLLPSVETCPNTDWDSEVVKALGETKQEVENANNGLSVTPDEVCGLADEAESMENKTDNIEKAKTRKKSIPQSSNQSLSELSTPESRELAEIDDNKEASAKTRRNRKVISYNEDDLEKMALEQAAKLKEIEKLKNKEKKLKKDAEENELTHETLEKNDLAIVVTPKPTVMELERKVIEVEPKGIEVEPKSIEVKPKAMELEPIGYDKGYYPVIAEAVVDILHADQIEALKEVNNVTKYGNLLRSDMHLDLLTVNKEAGNKQLDLTLLITRPEELKSADNVAVNFNDKTIMDILEKEEVDTTIPNAFSVIAEPKELPSLEGLTESSSFISMNHRIPLKDLDDVVVSPYNLKTINRMISEKEHVDTALSNDFLDTTELTKVQSLDDINGRSHGRASKEILNVDRPKVEIESVGEIPGQDESDITGDLRFNSKRTNNVIPEKEVIDSPYELSSTTETEELLPPDDKIRYNRKSKKNKNYLTSTKKVESAVLDPVPVTEKNKFLNDMTVSANSIDTIIPEKVDLCSALPYAFSDITEPQEPQPLKNVTRKPKRKSRKTITKDYSVDSILVEPQSVNDTAVMCLEKNEIGSTGGELQSLDDAADRFDKIYNSTFNNLSLEKEAVSLEEPKNELNLSSKKKPRKIINNIISAKEEVGSFVLGKELPPVEEAVMESNRRKTLNNDIIEKEADVSGLTNAIEKEELVCTGDTVKKCSKKSRKTKNNIIYTKEEIAETLLDKTVDDTAMGSKESRRKTVEDEADFSGLPYKNTSTTDIEELQSFEEPIKKGRKSRKTKNNMVHATEEIKSSLFQKTESEQSLNKIAMEFTRKKILVNENIIEKDAVEWNGRKTGNDNIVEEEAEVSDLPYKNPNTTDTEELQSFDEPIKKGRKSRKTKNNIVHAQEEIQSSLLEKSRREQLQSLDETAMEFNRKNNVSENIIEEEAVGLNERKTANDNIVEEEAEVLGLVYKNTNTTDTEQLQSSGEPIKKGRKSRKTKNNIVHDEEEIKPSLLKKTGGESLQSLDHAAMELNRNENLMEKEAGISALSYETPESLDKNVTEELQSLQDTALGSYIIKTCNENIIEKETDLPHEISSTTNTADDPIKKCSKVSRKTKNNTFPGSLLNQTGTDDLQALDDKPIESAETNIVNTNIMEEEPVASALPYEFCNETETEVLQRDNSIKKFGRKSRKTKNNVIPAKDEIKSALLERTEKEKLQSLDETGMESNTKETVNETIMQKEAAISALLYKNPNTTEEEEIESLNNSTKRSSKKSRKPIDNLVPAKEEIGSSPLNKTSPEEPEIPDDQVVRPNRRSRKAINYNEDISIGKPVITEKPDVIVPKDVFDFDESNSDEDKGYKSMLIETDTAAEQSYDNLKNKVKKRGRKKDIFDFQDNKQQSPSIDMENIFDFGDELDLVISDKKEDVNDISAASEDNILNDKIAKPKKQRAVKQNSFLKHNTNITTLKSVNKAKLKNKNKGKPKEAQEKEEDIFAFKDEEVDLNKEEGMEYQLDMTDGSKIKIKKCFITSKTKNDDDKRFHVDIKETGSLQVEEAHPEVIKDIFEFEDSYSDKDSNKTENLQFLKGNAKSRRKVGKRKQALAVNAVVSEHVLDEPEKDNNKRIKKNYTHIDVSNILEPDSSSRRSSKKVDPEIPTSSSEAPINDNNYIEAESPSPIKENINMDGSDILKLPEEEAHQDIDEINSKASDSFSNVASPLCSPSYNSDDSLPLLDRVKTDDTKPKNNDILFDQLLELGPTSENKSLDLIEERVLEEKTSLEGRLANINIKELLLSSVAPPDSTYADSELDEKKITNAILPEDVTISALKEMFSEMKPLSEIINSSEMDIAPVLDEIDKSLESEDIYDFNEDVRTPPISKRRSKNNKTSVKAKKGLDKSVEIIDKIVEEEPTANGKFNSETIKESDLDVNLRRSRRGNRKVASYNENDLIDPLIDALEKCRNKAKKVEEKPIPNNDKPNLNSEELFELLKKTTDVQTAKTLETVSNDVQDDDECSSNGAFDNVPDDDFDEVPDKVHEVPEDSPENTDLLANQRKPQDGDSNYCDICKKSFIRQENLLKHRTTLTHISKLSELEAKEAEERARAEKLNEPATEDVEDNQLPNHSLKLVDIISDVLNKPVLPSFEKQQQEFLPPIETNNMRYKSLGERKSFESEHFQQTAVPYQSSILENQIHLLENIIENNLENIASNNKHQQESDEISYCSSTSNKSGLQINTEGDFIKPGQYEEISEDSTSARIYDESKQRKRLNRDEELFLECCSLLKSGSEVSNSVKTAAESKLLKNRTVITAQEEAQEYKYNHSRTPTPLGDTYDDDASNSNTISSNWHLSSERSLDKNRSFSFGELREKEAPGISFGEVLTQGMKNQFVSSAKTIERTEELPPEEPPLSPISDKRDDSDCSTTSKKMVTKGARKVYEGLKVSIPTEDLNLEVLNTSPQNRKPDSTKTSPDSPRVKPRKSKPVKKSQVGSNLLFKVTKKKSPIVAVVVDDVFIKPGPIVIEKPKPESDDDSYSDSIGADAKSVSSFSSISTVPIKKPDNTPENITKNKFKIMGKIFKNAVRSKQEDIEEELRNIPEIPEIDNLEMVENYVRSCQEVNKNLLLPPAVVPGEASKKPKMTEEEMNMLFDQLLGKEIQEAQALVEAKTKIAEPKRKYTKTKGRKRARTTSDASDDEFNITKTTKKRTSKKNNPEDSGINLELEMKECIGVASRKSQRSCTSGKQNILVEYWSSDEEAFEAMLESQVTAKKEKKKIVTDEETMKPPAAPRPSKPKKKLTQSKKQPISAEQAATNRRKRAAANPLYHWSSSSEDESQSLIEVKPVREEDDDDDRPIQHGWIVGDSPKKLVTMLALTKGKKTDFDGVKEQGKRRTSNAAS